MANYSDDILSHILKLQKKYPSAIQLPKIIRCTWCPETFKSRCQKCRHQKKCKKKPSKKKLAEAEIRIGLTGSFNDLIEKVKKQVECVEEQLKALKRSCSQLEMIANLIAK